LRHKRSQIREDKESTKRIILFLADDLQKRLNFIEEMHQYNDFKPFFTDMWDAVILAGKHALLPLNCLGLQRTHSWMKYYNSELNSKTVDEKVFIDLLDDVPESIHRSLSKLNEIKGTKDPSKDRQRIDTVGKTTIDARKAAIG
jgi:hypothetical protein